MNYQAIMRLESKRERTFAEEAMFQHFWNVALYTGKETNITDAVAWYTKSH